MHELFNWDDDDRPYARQNQGEPVPELYEPPAPASKPEAETVTFRDACDGVTRTGRIVRTITSNEHMNPHVGKLPATTLYLVAYESATRRDDLTVISQSAIVRPPKPRP